MKLYKYYGLNDSNVKTIITSLSNEYLLFAKCSELNDLNEGRWRLEYNFNDTEDRCFVSECRKQVEAKLNPLNKALQEKVKVLCLTKTFTSECMWAHYANNHKGICVQIEIPDEIINFVKKVDYNKRVSLNLNIKRMTIKEEQQLRKNSLSESQPKEKSTFSDEVYNSLFFKSPEWSYENEYRIASISDELLDLECIKKENNKLFLKAKVTGVILGYRFKENSKGIIKKVIKWLHKEKIPVCKITLKHTDYNLHTKEVKDVLEEYK